MKIIHFSDTHLGFSDLDIVNEEGVNQREADFYKAFSDVIDAILETKPVGKRVAIIGAGGIGFDLAEYITEPRSLYSELVLRFKPKIIPEIDAAKATLINGNSFSN